MVGLTTLSVRPRGQPTPGRPHLSDTTSWSHATTLCSAHSQTLFGPSLVVLLSRDEPLGPAGPGLAHLALFGLIQSDFQGPKRADRQGPRGYLCQGPWARNWGLEVGLYLSGPPAVAGPNRACGSSIFWLGRGRSENVSSRTMGIKHVFPGPKPIAVPNTVLTHQCDILDSAPVPKILAPSA